MTFRVGQKVVCVDGGPGIPRRLPSVHAIPYGTIVTIRDIEMRGVTQCGHSVPTVRLAEYINPTINTRLGPWELGYDTRCFRPLTERKTETGMAILREILDRESHQDKPPVKRTAYS